jgi:hypothetical protein
MNIRFVVLGALLIVIGGLFLFYPSYFSSPSTVYDRTFLVRVAPGNYSYVQATVNPQQTLQATIASGPTSVDFFLMNNDNFSAWTNKGSPPSQVYPQSKFDVQNYSFSIAGTGSSEDYYLLLNSRDLNMSTSVLVHLMLLNGPGTLETLAPLVFIVLGVVVAVFGATRRKKVEEPPPEAEENTGGGGLFSLFSGSSPEVPKCRFCGAELQVGSKFCPSCHTAQA